MSGDLKAEGSLSHKPLIWFVIFMWSIWSSMDVLIFTIYLSSFQEDSNEHEAEETWERRTRILLLLLDRKTWWMEKKKVQGPLREESLSAPSTGYSSCLRITRPARIFDSTSMLILQAHHRFFWYQKKKIISLTDDSTNKPECSVYPNSTFQYGNVTPRLWMCSYFSWFFFFPVSLNRMHCVNVYMHAQIYGKKTRKKKHICSFPTATSHEM